MENILKTANVIEIQKRIRPSVDEKMLKKYEEFSQKI